MSLRNPNRSPILTKVELAALRQVFTEPNLPEDPRTLAMTLAHTVERLVKKIEHMQDAQEDFADAVNTQVTVARQAVGEVEQALNVLNSVAGDLLFDITS